MLVGGFWRDSGEGPGRDLRALLSEGWRDLWYEVELWSAFSGAGESDAALEAEVGGEVVLERVSAMEFMG